MKSKATKDSVSGATSRLKTVVCPQCKKSIVYSLDNPARPFCSPICKALDLGAWATESFTIAAGSDPDPDVSVIR